MQKKIVALAVAGLSTAAFAQTNVTIYGTIDESAQGFSMSKGKALNSSANGTGIANTANTQQPAQGNVFSLQNNSSLIGFKGTEDLGNGLKALFQAETTVNISGGSNGVYANNSASVFGATRDTFVGLNSKYGTAMAGYISTPFRSSLNSFDVMPGATGSGKIEQMMGSMRFSQQLVDDVTSQTGYEFSSSIRATAIAYAMPTLYGFNGSVAYTGSNNNGNGNTTGFTAASGVSASSQAPQSVFGFNLGWTGYGVDIKGAFQQANNNLTATSVSTANLQGAGDYTSYLIGAAYTGLPGLKLSAVYNRNSLGMNQSGDDQANKMSNNQLYTGASYRMGNWEPRVSAVWSSAINGLNGSGDQTGARQWTANVGYYLSKRTQVYGLVSNLNNSANQNYAMGQQNNNLRPTGGQNLFTYGMGLRTNF